MVSGKAAATWCRVSTHDQRELSLESQEAAVRKALEAQGYNAPPGVVLPVTAQSLSCDARNVLYDDPLRNKRPPSVMAKEML